MEQPSLVLAALAPAKGQSLSPVQVQKLLFLIDREIPNELGGHHFNFVPYDYGPFDNCVYNTLDLLALGNLVESLEEPGRRWKRYRLTPEGQKRGDEVLERISKVGRDYIVAANKFVRSLSFADLVSAIYRAYPDMKVNSVFGK